MSWISRASRFRSSVATARAPAASSRERSTARLTSAPAVVRRLSSSSESTRQSELATFNMPSRRSPTARGTLAWQRRLVAAGPSPATAPTTFSRRLHQTTFTFAAPRRSPARKVDRQ